MPRMRWSTAASAGDLSAQEVPGSPPVEVVGPSATTGTSSLSPPPVLLRAKPVTVTVLVGRNAVDADGS